MTVTSLHFPNILLILSFLTPSPAKTTWTSPDSATVVLLVRHTEKGRGTDPSLTKKGRARARALITHLSQAGVVAIYVTLYKRTQETAEPLAQHLRISPLVRDSYVEDEYEDARHLLDEIRARHKGETVLIVGHSNTVPVMIEALGIHPAPKIGEDDYGQLFTVILENTGSRMLTSYFGIFPK